MRHSGVEVDRVISFGSSAPAVERQRRPTIPGGLEHHRRVAAYVVVMAALFVGYVFGGQSVLFDNPQLDNTIDLAGGFLALTVGLTALFLYYRSRQQRSSFLFYSIGFIGAAVLQESHATLLAWLQITHESTLRESLLAWSRTAPALVLSVMLWSAYLLSRIESAPHMSARTRRRLILIIAISIAIASLFVISQLSRLVVHGSPPFWEREQIVPALFFFMALVGYLSGKGWRAGGFEHWLVLSLVVASTNALLFEALTSYGRNDVLGTGEVLQSVSYALALVGFLVSIWAVMRQTEETTQQLSHANKTLRDQLVERVEAERAVTEQVENLETFAYSISHDLHAPLRRIEGFTRILLHEYAIRLDASGEDYLRRIQSATSDMSRLIDALLQFSIAEHQEVILRPVNLSFMARSVIEELYSAEPQRAVDFVVADGLHAYGDERLLRIVFANLLGNAWKFTRREQRAYIRFGSVQRAGGIVYCVRDNGVGFHSGQPAEIFAPFRRQHSAGEFEGTGLGLATVRRIISRHGGDIWAESKEGFGTTLYFTLARPEQGSEPTAYEDVHRRPA